MPNPGWLLANGICFGELSPKKVTRNKSSSEGIGLTTLLLGGRECNPPIFSLLM